MRRVFKVQNQYKDVPIKCMYKLRRLRKLREKYNTADFEDKWICWYYFPYDYFVYPDYNEDYVNILNGEIDSDYQEDEEWYEDETLYYTDECITPKDRHNYMNKFKLPVRWIRSIRFLNKFPWEDAEEVRDTFPEKIYWFDGTEYHACDTDNIDNMYYY